ncbi:MAG: MBL fold metallo-hydrolase RNA specificity domain-containing protein [Opitutaceae bacterium]|nr:MBL fold metallo-hydrolase RNA specificity domain-containing protein [Opitutaceae bacterium]
MSWEIKLRRGLYLPQIGWWLDASVPVDRSFVSHAHSDHIAAHREIICTASTARLMRQRLPGRRIEHLLPFGHTEQLTPDCAVTLHPAGHILGSAQVLLEHGVHGRLLYTGDFKPRSGLAAEPCAAPRADVLVMETTFGLPRYVFPPAEEVLADIVAFCRKTLEDRATPVLLGYNLGKSQELLQVVGRAGLPVMLPPPACAITRAYEELGLRFPSYQALQPERASGHVVIAPPGGGGDLLGRLAARRTAVVSGWAIDPATVYRHRCDAAFPLSDHADFNELLAFVAAVRPRRVFTVHGFAREFAQTLRRRGVEAWALGEDNQLELELTADPRT